MMETPTKTGKCCYNKDWNILLGEVGRRRWFCIPTETQRSPHKRAANFTNLRLTSQNSELQRNSEAVL